MVLTASQQPVMYYLGQYNHKWKMKSFQLMNSSLLKHSENIPYTVNVSFVHNKKKRVQIYLQVFSK